MRLAARVLHAHDLVVDLRVATRKERAAIDHHVHLVRSELHGVTDVGELHVERVLARRKSVARRKRPSRSTRRDAHARRR